MTSTVIEKKKNMEVDHARWSRAVCPSWRLYPRIHRFPPPTLATVECSKWALKEYSAMYMDQRNSLDFLLNALQSLNHCL